MPKSQGSLSTVGSDRPEVVNVSRKQGLLGLSTLSQGLLLGKPLIEGNEMRMAISCDDDYIIVSHLSD